MLLARRDRFAQRSPAFGVLADPAQGPVRPHVQRIERQHLAQRRLRVGEPLGLSLLDVGHQHEELLAQARLLGGLEHQAGAIGDFGQLADQLGELDQSLTHGMVGRVDLEDAADRRIGGDRVAQRAGVEIGQHLEAAPALAIVLGHAHQRFERAGPLAVVLGQLVVGRQAPGHRRDILVANRAGGEHALQAFDRAAGDVVELERLHVRLGGLLVLPKLLLADAAQVQQRGGARGFVTERRQTHEHDGQAVEVPLLLEQTRQLAQGAQVLGFDLNRLLQAARGSLAVAQLLLFQPGDAQQGLGAQQGIGHAPLPGRLQGDQLRPALLQGEQLDQRELGLRIPRHFRENGFGEALQVGGTVGVGDQDVQAPAQQVQPFLGRGRPLASHALALDEEREQHVPLLGFGTQPFQIRPHLFVGRRQAVGPRAPLEGEPLGLQPPLADDAGALQNRQAGFRVEGRRGFRTEDDLEGRHQAAPALGLLVELGGLLGHRPVFGLGGENALVGLDHALTLAETVAGNVGHPLESAHAQAHVGGALGQAREHVAQIVPGVADGVERFQGVDVADLRIGLAQGTQHAWILGLGRVHAAQGLQRRAPRAQLLEQDEATLFEQGAALGATLPARGLGQAAQDLGQCRPALLAFVEPDQGRGGRPVGGRQLQHLVPQANGLAQIREPLGGQDCHLGQVVTPRVLLEQGQFAPEQLEQRAPRATARVDLTQGAARLGVSRVRLQDLFQRGDGVVVVAELLDPQVGDAVVEPNPGRGVGGGLGLAHQHAGQIAPARLRLVALGQRGERLPVIRPQGQDRRVGVDHHGLELQAVAVDGDHVEVARDLLVGLAGREGLALILE